jgi:GT2 family glycosyltransferase
MNDKIGLGIVTYNRPAYFKKIFATVPLQAVDEIVVVNDGIPYQQEISVKLIQHDANQGVGISKNDALRYLLDQGCDHLFLMEDDILIKDMNVFQKYIAASKQTGIQHFNYSQHGLMNKRGDGTTPNPRFVVEYNKDTSIALYPHCVGAFSYYSRKCIDAVGLIDEDFYNACEHVEHTYRIIKHNMHPPFWSFADIANSCDYLNDIPWSIETSTISSRPDHQSIVRKSDALFIQKHGLAPVQIPVTTQDDTKLKLKEIYKQHA